eukprot:4766065-Heterocapsa_arctica.AAC.1
MVTARACPDSFEIPKTPNNYFDIVVFIGFHIFFNQPSGRLPSSALLGTVPPLAAARCSASGPSPP